MTLVWRLVGLSQIVLGLAHVLLWRWFGWSRELTKLSPLTARVFAVHTFFVAFVLVLLGSLEACRPDLLQKRSDLARIFLLGTTMFWTLRLIAQPLVFDPVLLRGSSLRTPVRAAAVLLFASYIVVHAYGVTQQ